MLSDHRKFARAGSRKRIVVATLDTWNERNVTTLYARRNHYVFKYGIKWEKCCIRDKYWKYDPQIRFYPKGRVIAV